MAAVNFELVSRMAQVFNPREDGWSESVKLTFNGEIDGFIVNPDTQVKEAGRVNHISVFIGEVVRGLCAADATVAAFLAAKSHEQKLQLVPMLLSNAKVKFTRELDAENNQYITEIESIHISEQFLQMIAKALADLFKF